MRIGNHFDSHCVHITLIYGLSLPWATELRYLGVYILNIVTYGNRTKVPWSVLHIDYVIVTYGNRTKVPWSVHIEVCNFKCSLDYAERAFYCAANAIFGKVAIAASEEVVLQLVKSKSYPVLL